MHHHESFKKEMPYIVYSEYRKRSKYADNKPYAGVWRVQVDYYTKKRTDPRADQLEELLIANEVPYTYARVYDAELKAVRHLFDCDGVQNG